MKEIKGYTINVNSALTVNHLKRIAKNVKVPEDKIKRTETFSKTSTKKNLIKLLEENGAKKIKIYPFTYKKRFNFFAEKADEGEKADYHGLSAFLKGVQKGEIPRIGDNDTHLWQENLNLNHVNLFTNAVSIVGQYKMETYEELNQLVPEEEEMVVTEEKDEKTEEEKI